MAGLVDMAPRSTTRTVVDGPIEGVPQALRGARALAPAVVSAARPFLETASGRQTPLPAPSAALGDAMNAGSDIIEGGFKTLEPAVVAGAVTNPITTAAALTAAGAAQAAAEKAVQATGGSPAAARLAGNVAAAIAAGPAAAGGHAVEGRVGARLFTEGSPGAEAPPSVPEAASPAAPPAPTEPPVVVPETPPAPPPVTPGVADVSDIVAIEPPEGAPDAVRVETPSPVDVREQAGDGAGVGGQNAEREAPAGTGAAGAEPGAEAPVRGPDETPPPAVGTAHVSDIVAVEPPNVAHIDDIVDVVAPGQEQIRLPGDVGAVREPQAMADEPNPITVRRFTDLPPDQAAIHDRVATRVETTPSTFVDEYRRRFRNVVSADSAKELFDDYAASNETRTQNDLAVHRPASAVAQKVYEQILDEPLPRGHEPSTILTAGGTGSGKTTSLADLFPEVRDRARVVYDSTLTNLDAAVRNIDHARRVGDEVTVVFTDRQVEEAFRSTLTRATDEGRPVTIGTHASTHEKAPQVLQQLREHYANDPKVEFFVVSNSAAGRDLVPLEDWTPRRYNRGDVEAHLRRILDEEHAAGRVSDQLKAAVDGPARSRAVDAGGDRPVQPNPPSGRPPENARGTGEVVAPVPAAQTPAPTVTIRRKRFGDQTGLPEAIKKKDGFTVSWQDERSAFPQRIFVESRARAEAVRDAVRRGVRGAELDAVAFGKADSAKSTLSDLGKKPPAGDTTLESTLVPGARQFAEQDLVPAAAKAVQTLARVADDIKKAFAPYTRGDAARETGRILRAHLGEFAHRTTQVSEALKTARTTLDQLPRESRLRFIDDIEHGRPAADAKLQPVQEALRAILDDRRRQVQAHGRLDDFIQNYFPHIWKDPKAATAWVRGLMRRPLEGPKTFLKKRSIPTTAAGIARGLEPVSDNPVDLTLLKVREMDKWLMARSTIAEMKAQDLAKFVHSKKTAPDGWVPIQDPIGTVYGRSDKGELVVRGRYYAPQQAADLLNNHLSPGLRGKPLYDAYMWVGNSLNQLQLALPGFHAATSAVNAVASKQALALEAFARGDIKEGLKALASSPFAPVTDIVTGHQLLKGYRADVPGDPEIAAIVDHIVQAGGRASIDPIYTNDTWKGFTQALRSGNYPGAALRVLPALIEAASKPVMELYVPRLKVAAFADLARLEMRRLGADASMSDVRGAMQKAWDSVDNRFGQVVYDNLFLNRVLKDVLHASVRSVGWNLGTLRELGGGVYDMTLPQFRRHAGDGPGERVDPRLSHRTAFLVSMSVTTGLMAAVYQFLHTGQPPQSPKDLVFPRTGDTAPDGSDQRVSMPGYLKDAYAMTTKPVQTAEHKLHPFLSLIAQSAENADYYGVEIRHKDDPLVQQLQDYVSYLTKEATPIAFQNALKRRQEGSGVKGFLESQLGISPAPRNVVSPPTAAEELAREYLGPPDVRTKEQETKRVDAQRYREAVRKGDEAAAGEVVKAGRLTDTRLREIQSTVTMTPLQANFRRLTVEQAFHVMEAATPAERGALMPLLETKLGNAEIAPADAARLKAEWQRIKALPTKSALFAPRSAR
jgi:hypothetical protein